jgi:hypothetical protein
VWRVKIGQIVSYRTEILSRLAGNFWPSNRLTQIPAKCGSVSLVAAAEHGGQFDFSSEANCLSECDEMKKGETTSSSLRALIASRTEGRTACIAFRMMRMTVCRPV